MLKIHSGVYTHPSSAVNSRTPTLVNKPVKVFVKQKIMGPAVKAFRRECAADYGSKTNRMRTV